MSKVFIVGAKRTAFGAFGGSLKDIAATDLAVTATKAALAQAKVSPSLVDNVVVGLVAHASRDSAYTARHVALKSGAAIETPALTLNRLCGSGFQSVATAASSIILGESSIAVAAGTESMSLCPHVTNVRWGTKFGGEAPRLDDSLWDALTDTYAGVPMGITAETLGAQYGLTRQDTDAYALQSQQRWAEADKAGRFADEIAPIELKDKKKQAYSFAKDEHPKPASTAETLAKLPSVFKKDGLVTAASASGICDGAGSIVVASEAACAKHGLAPLARVVGWHVSGVDPKIMGIGPVPAIRALLAKHKLTIADIDLFDINEAFAAQFLSCKKELGLDNAKTNVNGGAIALGHPLAASGSRITANLVYELKRRNARYGVGAACIGGGQGIAILLERV